MKTKITVLVLLIATILSSCGIAKKKYLKEINFSYDKETGYVSEKGKINYKIIKGICVPSPSDCHFDVFDIDDKKELIIDIKKYNSPMEISKQNPDGTVVYYTFVFLADMKKTEIGFTGFRTENIAKFISVSKLFKDGYLDKTVVDEFILRNGTPYSEKIKY